MGVAIFIILKYMRDGFVFRAAEMPEHAYKASMKELKRLKKMPQHMPEQAMIR